MKKYEIYRSEGGFRVAANVYLGCPVVGSSPWFANKGLAMSWRNSRIEQDKKRYQEEIVWLGLKAEDLKYTLAFI